MDLEGVWGRSADDQNSVYEIVSMSILFFFSFGSAEDETQSLAYARQVRYH